MHPSDPVLGLADQPCQREIVLVPFLPACYLFDHPQFLWMSDKSLTLVGQTRVCRPESALAHSPAFSPSHGLPLSSIAVDALYSESLTHSLPASELCALPYFLNQVLSLKVRPFHPSVIPVFIFTKSLTSLHYSEFPSTVPCWLGTQNKTLLTIICVCASIIESKLQAWHHK